MKLPPRTLAQLAAAYGGQLQDCARVRGRDEGDQPSVSRIAPILSAGSGDLAPLLARRFVRAAALARGRGATLLISAELAALSEVRGLGGWVHPHASWVLAQLLDECEAPREKARIGKDCVLGAGVVLDVNVTIGDRVMIGAGSVIGRPGFGWATGPDGALRAVPQLGGVVIEDDVAIGPLCTIDAGTLGATRIRRGAKLDAQCHVAHNCDIGELTIVAAQCGFAGSVTIGRSVLIGGQAGVADHVTIGDGARIAAKSGVIGDVPPGAVVAGYPAVPRVRWLRALAQLYRGAHARREK